MPFYYTLDYLSGNYALVFIKKSGAITPHHFVFQWFLTIPQ